MASWERHDWRTLLAVGAGGAVGALCRWGIDCAVRSLGQPLPWATLAVNVIGCLLMGFLVAAVLGHPRRHPLWRPLLGVGFLGGFTTFSAFAGDVIVLLRGGDAWAALAYLVASVVGSLLAVVLGFRGGEAVLARRPPS